ncbi:MAG: hypothetical protein ACLQVN_08460 [Bryobacteraceae bacterium]
MRAGENGPSVDVGGMFVRGFHQFAGLGFALAGFTFAGFEVEAVPVVGKRYSRLPLELALQPLGCFIALFFHARQLFLSFLG